METLQNRTKELEFQLREATERCAMLEDSASSSRPKDRGRATLGFGLFDGNRGTPSPSPSRSNSYSNANSAAEVQRVLAEAEARSEAKLADLRFKIRSLENERNEAEEEWAAKLQDRMSELEKLRRTITEKESEYAESLRTRKEKEGMIEEQEEARRAVEREMKSLRAEIESAKADVSVAADAEVSAPWLLSLHSPDVALASGKRRTFILSDPTIHPSESTRRCQIPLRSTPFFQQNPPRRAPESPILSPTHGKTTKSRSWLLVDLESWFWSG